MRRLAGMVAALTLLAGCSYDDTPLPEPEAAAPATPAAPVECTTDEDPLASYDPSSAGGATLEEIRDRERLIVGVSADTYKMGAFDPEDGRIEGFDIDIAQAIAKEIFGEDFVPGRSLQLRVITAAQRIPLLEEEQIDLVVRNMTINCERWEQVAFSSVYYAAEQRVLVREDLAEGDSLPDLAGLRVCAPTGSTSLDNIEEQEPDVEIVPADTHTGCLIKLQQSEVDAITGDDTVLAGLAAQDPYTVVPSEQPFLSNEPYGVAANAENVDLVRFVNAVLDDLREDGSWQRSYDEWLAPYLGPASPPQPTYGRQLP